MPTKRRDRSPPLERKQREEILGEIVNHAESALDPINGNQVLAKNHTLFEPRILDHLAQFHIVEDFHTQGKIAADRVIHGAAAPD
jgi:hypothetical protein